MRTHHKPVRPVRLLAALAMGAAAAALVTRWRGPSSWPAATTPAEVGRQPGGGAGEAAEPGRRAGRGPDELRLWVETGCLPAPARPEPVRLPS
ncbi:hypothetical protein ONA70_17145 [Micromonospora yasonensis]|uniref:hypothetical protein n=1 Tax=Micromonospora yasonensis TaxID=1128667 RepID=UPI0022315C5E|nr:hypothetical protein [Micromonospora yasonensis]MCW3841829.1 hypothetical protein [Micromonospora yasonensis]